MRILALSPVTPALRFSRVDEGRSWWYMLGPDSMEATVCLSFKMALR